MTPVEESVLSKKETLILIMHIVEDKAEEYRSGTFIEAVNAPQNLM
jgi:hypothetical protein